MPDNALTVPLSDTIRLQAALRAAQRARAIAISQEFDLDAVELMLERAEQELKEATLAAGLPAMKFELDDRWRSQPTTFRPGEVQCANLPGICARVEESSELSTEEGDMDKAA